MKSRDAIFIAISQLRYDELTPFLLSVKRCGSHAEVVCFAGDSDPDTLQKLKRDGITIVPMKEHLLKIPFVQRKINMFKWAYPLMMMYRSLYVKFKTRGSFSKHQAQGQFSMNYTRICSMRFFYFLQYLQAHQEDYDRVLLTDVRDVVFQTNIFNRTWEADSLYCFLESEQRPIVSDTWNHYWIDKIGGQALLQEIGHHPISCAGVTFGTTNVMLKYLKKMCYYLSEKVDRLDLDQGFHNVIVWRQELENIKLGKCNESEVLTAGLLEDAEFHFDDKDRLINKDGSVIDIVHQYDRKPILQKKLLKG